MSPLSEQRTERLVAELAARSPATVLDLGCGWGELLLRIVGAAPGAIGTGVDLHAPGIERGRAAAEARGLSDRVTLTEGKAEAHPVQPMWFCRSAPIRRSAASRMR
ncbi:class I SAM-dependent methyltransferase [Actinoplanes sp. NPDC023801]|uniref:SAM-dependent methyltransferase n=1 Tax=Actinoplanes sp. NPDC023801 TaxID=3154595 RepID=UPI0033E412B7